MGTQHAWLHIIDETTASGDAMASDDATASDETTASGAGKAAAAWQQRVWLRGRDEVSSPP